VKTWHSWIYVNKNLPALNLNISLKNIDQEDIKDLHLRGKTNFTEHFSTKARILSAFLMKHQLNFLPPAIMRRRRLYISHTPIFGFWLRDQLSGGE
jgi:hypothetical protein